MVLDDVDDLIVEAQETFTAQALAVTSGGGAIVVAGSRDVVIDDNDSASVAITTPGTTTVTEGGLSADVSVTLTLNTTGTGTPSLGVPISVNLPGNADYTATAATFAAGSLNGATANVSVSAEDDRRVEPSESFAGQTLAVTAANGANVTAGTSQTIVVNDNDSATVSIPAGTTGLTEGGTPQNLTATLTLNTPGTGTQVLDVDVSANLAGNADYTSNGVTFAAGSVTNDTQNLTLDAVNDQRVEATVETFAGQALAITAANGVAANATGTQTVTVTDNDSASVAITSAGTSTTVTEGGATADVEVTLTLTTNGLGSAALAVPVNATLPGNADYTAAPAIFAVGTTSGVSANIVVAAVNDNFVEATTETFANQALGVTTTATATATTSRDIIVNENDSASVAITSPGTTTVTEGGPSANVGVTLTLNTNGTGAAELAVPVSVNLSGNGDYTATAATFGVRATGGASANVVVAAVNDQAVEPFIETFTGQALAVSANGGANVSASTSQRIDVVDNDKARITYSGTANLTEGSLAAPIVTATLSLVTDGTGTIQLDTPVSATIGSPSNDFTATTVTWNAGDAPGAKDIGVTVINDRLVEQSVESLTANLVPTSAAVVDATGSATVDVNDNESASVTIVGGTTTVTEGGSSANVAVTLSMTGTGSGPLALAVPVSADPTRQRRLHGDAGHV